MMQALETLEKLGYTLALKDDGNISIRGRPSQEADRALAVLRADKTGGGLSAPAGGFQGGQEGLSHRVRLLRGAFPAVDGG